MRNLVIWSVVLFAMAGTAFSENPKQPPKEVTVDLGKGVKLEIWSSSRRASSRWAAASQAEGHGGIFNKTYGEDFLKADFFKDETSASTT